ncbi:hypothetical protein GGR21_001588 [Dysgonomonas hofstadii]|uniref:DUF3575 domain-containing protein n=1 Tax=Dysgonomonas hofstadii TaxID=637886 RepID=A0A840CV75_9BACT|nr:hypothetical protein [Dysgonomonas hofstadii]MBB4035693.1 hypothetical protein [Dysgonomonas hofstadii]
MKIHIKRTVFILLLSLSGSLMGQEVKKRNTLEGYPKYTIAVQPFHLMNGTLKLDFETQLKSPKNWLQLSISGSYLGTRDMYSSNYSWSTFNSDFNDFSGLKGFGLGAAYKSIIYSTWLYYRAGVAYDHYRVKYPGFGYFPYIEDGLTYYEYHWTQQKQIFNKLSSSICIGMQSHFSNVLFFDAYIGIGYAYSMYDKDKRSFEEGMYGFGRRGAFLAGGVRIGVAFGK